MSKAVSLSPVFVYGALRSGTTLFRLMLNNHSKIKNPGEVDFLFDFLVEDKSHPSGWRYNRDRMTDDRIFKAHKLNLRNDLDGLDLMYDMISQFAERGEGVLTMNVHRNAALIARLLPEAKFIHLVRDPRDVARSSIGMGWSGNSYHGVSHWIATEKSWKAANIAAFKVFELQFEALMADIEVQLKWVCEFVGVAYSSTMLDYYLNTSYGPPDSSISQQWKHKATPREIALLEGRLGNMLAEYGYVPNGEPAFPGSLEKLKLDISNRTNRWRFNVRRYGLMLFLSSHITKRLGPRWLDRRLRLAMDERLVKTLK